METNLARDLFEYSHKKNELHPIKVASLNKILIVEDDTSLAHLLAQALEDTNPGIEIDWATSGEEAEYYLTSSNKNFGRSAYDLIIADIFLEGETTGLDIWKLCKKEYPDINILIMSGLPVDRLVSHLKHEHTCPHYLPKPFTMSECMEAINEFIE